MTDKQYTAKLEKLKEKKRNLESKWFEACEEEHRKMNNLGWGCNMRGYKRSMSLNLSKSDKIKERIKVVEQQIQELNNTYNATVSILV
jgi:hypothetical protein